MDREFQKVHLVTFPNNNHESVAHTEQFFDDLSLSYSLSYLRLEYIFTTLQVHH
jgi:hypothetical protein